MSWSWSSEIVKVWVPTYIAMGAPRRVLHKQLQTGGDPARSALSKPQFTNDQCGGNDHVEGKKKLGYVVCWRPVRLRGLWYFLKNTGGKKCSFQNRQRERTQITPQTGWFTVNKKLLSALSIPLIFCQLNNFTDVRFIKKYKFNPVWLELNLTKNVCLGFFPKKQE